MPFAACLMRFESPVELSDFYSTAVNEISLASKLGIHSINILHLSLSLSLSCLLSRTSRFATFPEYLILQMNRFFIGDDWTPQKYGLFSPSPSCPLLHCLHLHLSLLPSLLTMSAPPSPSIFSFPLANFSNPPIQELSATIPNPQMLK